MSRAYLKLNNVEIPGVVTSTRGYTGNVQTERNLDGGLVSDTFNGVVNSSWSFSIAIKSQADIIALEIQLKNLGQSTITLDLEDDATAYSVKVINGSIKSTYQGAYFDGVWNKAAGRLQFGCETA